mgnify:CR=1 FL=1
MKVGDSREETEFLDANALIPSPFILYHIITLDEMREVTKLPHANIL